MSHYTYPALIVRPIEDESLESFQGRKDQCRNASAQAGFGSPQKFEGNIFDETNLESEVFAKLGQWPSVIAYEAADIADDRDQFADRVNAIREAGSHLILVREGIDLRGGDDTKDGMKRAFDVWLELPGAGEVEEEAEPGNISDGVQPRRPKNMTEELEAVVRAHFAEHGTTKPTVLKKALGITSSGTAQNWLNWAERYPGAFPAPAPVEE